MQIEALAAAEDVVAQVALGIGRGDGRLESGLGVGVFRAQVDVAFGRADGQGGDGHTLDQHEGVVLHHHAVGEGARVALVGVADDVLLRRRAAGHGAPLDPGGKGRAAAPAQAGVEHLGDDRLGADFQRALETAVAVMGDIVGQRQWIGDPGAGKGQALLALEVVDFIGQAEAERMRAAVEKAGIE
ncbi:hypothetical protein D3C86_1407640 [compost metagenome]